MDATEPVFTFAEALAATGAENAWLRTFIQRDKEGRLGKKHRTGRLLFSLNHIMAIGPAGAAVVLTLCALAALAQR